MHGKFYWISKALSSIFPGIYIHNNKMISHSGNSPEFSLLHTCLQVFLTGGTACTVGIPSKGQAGFSVHFSCRTACTRCQTLAATAGSKFCISIFPSLSFCSILCPNISPVQVKSQLIGHFKLLPHHPKCVILSEHKRVEESTHFRKCAAEIQYEDPSTPALPPLRMTLRWSMRNCSANWELTLNYCIDNSQIL